MEEFASSKGFSDFDVFVDKTLKKSQQEQLEQMLEKVNDYDALIMKDFYHLRKNTGACMAELLRIGEMNIPVYTIEDGTFVFEVAPFEQPLKACIYYCGLESMGRSVELQYAIMEQFVFAKTNWTVVHKYADLDGNKVDGNQKELQKLVQNSADFDILLIQSYMNLHWRTSKFCKIRNAIQKGIYSMYEDIYLPYKKGEDK